ncbi:hypothetical protein BT69DRAFT_41502 [Atractiella rhizophila]|nr:hypothetical protein BT69DRAFT_41502 [Atractiella rhizophila]
MSLHHKRLKNFAGFHRPITLIWLVKQCTHNSLSAVPPFVCPSTPEFLLPYYKCVLHFQHCCNIPVSAMTGKGFQGCLMCRLRGGGTAESLVAKI